MPPSNELPVRANASGLNRPATRAAAPVLLETVTPEFSSELRRKMILVEAEVMVCQEDLDAALERRKRVRADVALQLYGDASL